MLQTDSNLVIYDGNQVPIWQVNYGGKNGQYSLVMQNDGNLVMYPDSYYQDSNGQSHFQINTQGAVWAASWWNNFSWRNAFSPLEPNFAVSFACWNSGAWRWNNYGGNNYYAQVGIWWDSQPPANALYSFHVVGYLGQEKVYVIASGGYWVDTNSGNGLLLDGQNWPFIITCGELSSDGFTGSDCIIAAFGIGCVQNIDAQRTIYLGKGQCGRFTIWRSQ
jgi:hypothetical protein